jgi:hypothetical protein
MLARCYPRRNIAKSKTELPHRPFQVVRLRAAELGAFLGEQAADLIDALVVAVTEAVEPVADFRLQLEAVESADRISHGK